MNKIAAPSEQVQQVQQQLAQAGKPASGEGGGRICFPFLNHGRCNHVNCRFRHLSQDHPDAVADRMRTGAYDKIPPHVNPMIDQNPNSKPGETRICYTYLNRGACERPECSFRHLLPGHPDAVADRIKNGQGHKIPPYAKEALARVGGGPSMGGTGGMQMMGGTGFCAPPGGGYGGTSAYGGGGRNMGGGGGGNGVNSDSMSYWQQYPSMQGWDQMQMPAGIDSNMQQGYSGGQQHNYNAAQQGFQPYGYPHDAARQGGAQYSTNQQAGMGGPAPGEQRICFPFLNRGACERGASCRYRHLAPDHPDAIADRMRTGRGPPAHHAPPMQDV